MSTELFTADEMPFNLISETIAAPVKILSPREEEASRAATVRAGGYENTPSIISAAKGVLQHNSYYDYSRLQAALAAAEDEERADYQSKLFWPLQARQINVTKNQINPNQK